MLSSALQTPSRSDQKASLKCSSVLGPTNISSACTYGSVARDTPHHVAPQSITTHSTHDSTTASLEQRLHSASKYVILHHRTSHDIIVRHRTSQRTPDEHRTGSRAAAAASPPRGLARHYMYTSHYMTCTHYITRVP
jgi:hypothetical protein